MVLWWCTTPVQGPPAGTLLPSYRIIQPTIFCCPASTDASAHTAPSLPCIPPSNGQLSQVPWLWTNSMSLADCGLPAVQSPPSLNKNPPLTCQYPPPTVNSWARHYFLHSSPTVNFSSNNRCAIGLFDIKSQ